MNYLLFGLLAAWIATFQLAAATNSTPQTNATASAGSAATNAVQSEYEKLQELDDTTMAEVDKWIRDHRAFAEQGADASDAALNERIRARLETVRQAYDEFLKRHPRHAAARLAYASFLEDLHEEDAALLQLEKARELDPKNPAVWNNLANHHGHTGKVKTAFECYAKALELNPAEPVYLQNFATTVYLFRKDAMEFFGISEPEVFDKALDLYRRALKFDPTNFNLATELAQTYYAIRPTRTDEALNAWTNALAIAHDDVERQGVQVHFARLKWLAGRTNEARAHLNLVTHDMYDELKRRLKHNWERAETAATNAAPAAVEKK